VFHHGWPPALFGIIQGTPHPLRTRHCEDHVADEPLERLVLDELLVDLRVVLQEVLHHLASAWSCAMRAVCGVFSFAFW
jgi:hypothetical protein